MRRRGWLGAMLLTVGIVLIVGAASAPFLLASPPASPESASAPVTQARELIILPVLLVLLVVGMVLGRGADSET